MFECNMLECCKCKIRHICDTYRVEIGFDVEEVFEETTINNKRPNKRMNLDYYDNLDY